MFADNDYNSLNVQAFTIIIKTVKINKGAWQCYIS